MRRFLDAQQVANPRKLIAIGGNQRWYVLLYIMLLLSVGGEFRTH